MAKAKRQAALKDGYSYDLVMPKGANTNDGWDELDGTPRYTFKTFEAAKRAAMEALRSQPPGAVAQVFHDHEEVVQDDDGPPSVREHFEIVDEHRL